MITTITGFNGKKNQSTYATALLASMCSLNKGTRTLVLQLVNKDMESVEYFLTGVEKSTVFVEEGLTFMNEGIDGLMRVADNLKLNKEDFDQMCLSLRKENRLDIAEMSKSNVFVSNLVPRIDNVNQILKNAQEVYDDIFVLLPSESEEAIKEINELEVVDRCIYCIKQGYYAKGSIYGEAPILLVLDYDENSKFTIKALRSSMKLGKNIITRKINYNVGAKDAAYMNELLGYMLANRDIEEEDVNYNWSRDIIKVLADVLGVHEHYVETEYNFEKNIIFEKNLKHKKSVKDHEKNATQSATDYEEVQVPENLSEKIVKKTQEKMVNESYEIQNIMQEAQEDLDGTDVVVEVQEDLNDADVVVEVQEDLNGTDNIDEVQAVTEETEEELFDEEMSEPEEIETSDSIQTKQTKKKDRKGKRQGKKEVQRG